MSSGGGGGRCRTSVGDIMSGGDLIRRPGSGDLLRSPELLVVEDLARQTTGSPVQRGISSMTGMSSGLRSRGRDGYSTLGRDSSSPPSSSGTLLGDRFRTSDVLVMDDFDVETSGCYRTLAGSPILEQHLMAGRDSIL